MPGCFQSKVSKGPPILASSRPNPFTISLSRQFTQGVNVTTDADPKTLVFRQLEVGGWSVPTVSFAAVARPPIRLQVGGEIINEFTDKTDKKREWKRRLASEVKLMRGNTPWDPCDNYAISLALKFCPGYHGGGGQRWDVENFIKPIIDAIAAGLFCAAQTDPSMINSWNFDDSNFTTLLIHRLPDTADRDAEGTAMFISAAQFTNR